MTAQTPEENLKISPNQHQNTTQTEEILSLCDKHKSGILDQARRRPHFKGRAFSSDLTFVF